MSYQMGIARSHPGIYHSSETIPVTWNDLSNVIKNYQEKQYEIIVGLDTNSDCDDESSNITNLRLETDLIDCFTLYFPGIKISSTSQGTNRIDAILISPNLIPMVHNIQFLPKDSIIESDHKAVVLELKYSLLFNRGCVNTTALMSRRLTMPRPKVITKYTDCLRQDLSNHKIQERIDKNKHRLETLIMDKHKKAFDNIAKQVTQMQLHAEKMWQSQASIPVVSTT